MEDPFIRGWQVLTWPSRHSWAREIIPCRLGLNEGCILNGEASLVWSGMWLESVIDLISRVETGEFLSESVEHSKRKDLETFSAGIPKEQPGPLLNAGATTRNFQQLFKYLILKYEWTIFRRQLRKPLSWWQEQGEKGARRRQKQCRKQRKYI